MGIKNVNSSCPNCGAPIEIDNVAQGASICKYCSSVVAVIANESNHANSSESLLPTLRKIEPELQYQANHQVSAMNAQGGHLWITQNEVVFKPHSLNFGPMGKRYIRIQDVIGYKKGTFTHMSIYTKSGYEMDIVVWKKDEIINEIEKRRINYFQSKGLPVPPLQYGNEGNGSGNISSDAVSAEQMSQNSGCMGVVVMLVISISAALYSIIGYFS